MRTVRHVKNADISRGLRDIQLGPELNLDISTPTPSDLLHHHKK